MPDRITANLPSRDFEATARFYAALGFEARFRDEGWMILGRGAMEIEFFPHPGLVPGESWFSACVRVEDVDGLYETWRTAGLPGAGIPRLTPPQDMAEHGLRMFAVVDADGSLLRCLGPIPGAGADGGLKHPHST